MPLGGSPEFDDAADALEELLFFLVTPEPWIDWAACKNMGLEDFFPNRGQSTKAAKACCAQCPVGQECDEYADRTHTQYGVWNGRTRKRGRTD